MNYNQEWKIIEEEHDRIKPCHQKEDIRPSISGINLNDVLIIRKWVDYAKGIGDTSVALLNQNTISDKKTYDRAKGRLNEFPFSH